MSIAASACTQVKGVLEAQAPNEATKKALLRALPTLEAIIDKLCAQNYNDPDRHIYLFASSRHGLVASASSEPVPIPDKEITQQFFAKDKEERRARLWSEVDKAIWHEKANFAVVLLRTLVGDEGWKQIGIASIAIVLKRAVPAVWVVTASHAGKACGAVGVLALPHPSASATSVTPQALD